MSERLTDAQQRTDAQPFKTAADAYRAIHASLAFGVAALLDDADPEEAITLAGHMAEVEAKIRELEAPHG